MHDHGHECNNDAWLTMVMKWQLMMHVEYGHGSCNDVWLTMVTEVAMMYG